MATRERFFCTVVLITVILSGASRVTGQTIEHVRTASPPLRGLIDDGLARSETLRELVDRLNASDVVVYISCGAIRSDSALGFGGWLQFVSHASGVRYARAQLNCGLPHDRQIALLGHELRHAVEVAEAPEIVDVLSFGRYFAGHGFEVSEDMRHRTYETDAAQLAQRFVRRDLLDSAAGEHLAARDK
ncbi:MAG TPA: hypothetical protein VG222_04750 [Vicinamibacterales bacterium]|nr:hypothetical protein [Vicinamibacterales bacterium]